MLMENRDEGLLHKVMRELQVRGVKVPSVMGHGPIGNMQT